MINFSQFGEHKEVAGLSHISSIFDKSVYPDLSNTGRCMNFQIQFKRKNLFRQNILLRK